MKLSKFSALSFIVVLLLFCSCSDDIEEILTDEEVANIIESSVSRDTYGVSEQSSSAARLAEKIVLIPTANCSVEQNSSVMVSSDLTLNINSSCVTT
jgi:hypothetical protein